MTSVMRWNAVLDDQTCDACRSRDGMRAGQGLSDDGALECTSERCRCVKRYCQAGPETPPVRVAKLFRARQLFRTVHALEDAIVSLATEPDSDEQRMLRQIRGRLHSRAHIVLTDAVRAAMDQHDAEWVATAVEEHLKRASGQREPGAEGHDR